MSLGFSIGLESIRRLSFNSTPPPKSYFDAEDASSPFPNLFINSIIFLERHGLNEEGLLRITGRINDIKHVRLVLLEGKKDGLQPGDVHTVASVLKAFFNDSPQSILPEDKYQLLIKIAQDDKEDVVDHLRNVILSLPVNHQKILHRLILFVDRVQSNSKINKMELVALSVILGPLLLRSPVPLAPAQQFADNAACVKVAYKLIENHQAIFEGIALNDLNVKEIDDSLKAKSYTEGIRSSPANSIGRRSFKLFRNTAEAAVMKSATFSSGPPPSNARIFYEKAALDMKTMYEDAKNQRERVVKEAQDAAIKEWKAFKAKADEEDKIYKIIEKKYDIKKEALRNASQLKEEATLELERISNFYQVTPENRSTLHETLQRDEIARLQEAQALVDWREAEVQLALYDLQAIVQEKSLVETPHEIAQAALWQSAQELKRLEITEEEAEKWTG